MVRESYGHRVYQKEQRLEEASKFNETCQMQQSEKIN